MGNKCTRTVLASLPLLWRTTVHAQLDTEITVRERFSSATLGVVVVTAGGDAYRQRVQQAHRTWGRGKPVIFVAAEAFPELGIQGTQCWDDAEQGMCCKTIAGLRLARSAFPRAQWIVRAADDTYVFLDHLEHELRIFRPSELIYVGSASVSTQCQFSTHASACAETHAGGAGIVLSTPLVDLLLEHADAFLASCHLDDLHLGHFLRYLFDVHLFNLPGILQEPRFRHITGTGQDGLTGRSMVVSTHDDLPPSCPSPLPPPVYARIDDWGPVHAFTPLDATRLALLHSDPAIWPRLSQLSSAIASLPPGRAILAFGDAHGRRVLGPHFEGLETLSVCCYARSERASSFKGIRTYQPAASKAFPELATLQWAAWHGHASLIGELCQAGAALDQKRFMLPVYEEFSALHFAVLQGHAAAVDALLLAGANASARATMSQLTPVELAELIGRGAEPVAQRLRAFRSTAASDA